MLIYLHARISRPRTQIEKTFNSYFASRLAIALNPSSCHSNILTTQTSQNQKAFYYRKHREYNVFIRLCNEIAYGFGEPEQGAETAPEGDSL